MADPTLSSTASEASTSGHPLDSFIARLSQGEDYFHPAIRVAWAIGQQPISLRDAMLYQPQFVQLLESAEREEKAIRALVAALGRTAITGRG